MPHGQLNFTKWYKVSYLQLQVAVASTHIRRYDRVAGNDLTGLRVNTWRPACNLINFNSNGDAQTFIAGEINISRTII